MTDLYIGLLKKGLGFEFYNSFIEQAKEFLERTPRILPTLEFEHGVFVDSQGLLHIPEINEININNYNPLPNIKAPLSVGN